MLKVVKTMDDKIMSILQELLKSIDKDENEKIEQKTKELMMCLEQEKDIDKRISKADFINKEIKKIVEQKQKDIREIDHYIETQSNRLKATQGYEKRNKF